MSSQNKQTFVNWKMSKGDTAFEVLSSDLHPVICVLRLVQIFEN